MKVTFKRGARLCLLITGIGAAVLFEAVAIVPARAVLRPRTHADPAELVLALATRHVITSSVLLDRRLTLATFLGVGRNPIGRLGVVCTLLLPHLDQSTRRWLMVVLSASKAKVVTTCTRDCRYYGVKVMMGQAALDRVFTVGCGAPAQVIQVGNISLILQASISICVERMEIMEAGVFVRM